MTSATTRQVRLADIKDDIPLKFYKKVLHESETLSHEHLIEHNFGSPTIDKDSRTFPVDFESAGTKIMFSSWGRSSTPWRIVGC